MSHNPQHHETSSIVDEMPIDFRPGQVVVLKSGGPAMTVSQGQTPTSTAISCVYYNTVTGSYDRPVFFACQLRLVKLEVPAWQRAPDYDRVPLRGSPAKQSEYPDDFWHVGAP